MKENMPKRSNAEKAIERLAKPERINLAKAKMKKVIDHFPYVVELHANNSFMVFSPVLASQIPRSYAANAFNVFQRSMHQIEIVRLCAIWDSVDFDKENIATVVQLIDDDEIIETLAEETRSHSRDGCSLVGRRGSLSLCLTDLSFERRARCGGAIRMRGFLFPVRELL